jgi:hypothetical protein
MFDNIAKISHDYLQSQIDQLKATCDKDPAVAEMVRYIVAYSDQMAYCSGDNDARIGRQIIQHIWEISKLDLSNMGNQYHFSHMWATELNDFINSYVHNGQAFDFDVDNFYNTVKFKPADPLDDTGRWLHDPMIIVEAAKANRAFYNKLDSGDIFTRVRGVKADLSQVLELVK